MKFRCCSIGGVQYRQRGNDLVKVGGDETVADLDDVCICIPFLFVYFQGFYIDH